MAWIVPTLTFAPWPLIKGKYCLQKQIHTTLYLPLCVWCTERLFCQLTAYIFDKRYMFCINVHAVEMEQCFMHVSIQLVEMACFSISPHPPRQLFTGQAQSLLGYFWDAELKTNNSSFYFKSASTKPLNCRHEIVLMWNQKFKLFLYCFWLSFFFFIHQFFSQYFFPRSVVSFL